ncbi:MAG TPA: hypothetical protein VFO63_15270 [Blastocatellia bacterium]|nr:hypothetical protein [Blastocatellia bacterium]
MSKELKRSAERLENEASHRAEAIRRVVREYHDTTRAGGVDLAARYKKRREIEREARDFLRLQKALKRIRREARMNKG